jgi:hypothetical protein
MKISSYLEDAINTALNVNNIDYETLVESIIIISDGGNKEC